MIGAEHILVKRASRKTILERRGRKYSSPSTLCCSPRKVKFVVFYNQERMLGKDGQIPWQHHWELATIEKKSWKQ